MITGTDKRRPSRADLQAENAALRAKLDEAQGDLARVRKDRDFWRDQADFYVTFAVEAYDMYKAMAVESDNLAAAAALALPDLGGPIFGVNPWAPAPIFEALSGERAA